MKSWNKTVIAVVQLSIMGVAFFAAAQAGIIGSHERHELLIGAGIGLVIGLGIVVARRTGVQFKSLDKLRLRLVLVWQCACMFLLPVYILCCLIALASGQRPTSASLLLAPLFIFGFGLATARAYVKLYRERLIFGRKLSPTEDQREKYQRRQRKFTRLANFLAIIQFAFLIEGGIIAHFDKQTEAAQRAVRTTRIESNINSIKRAVAAKTESPSDLQRRLEYVRQELSDLN